MTTIGESILEGVALSDRVAIKTTVVLTAINMMSLITYRKLRDSMVISSMDTAMSTKTVAKLHTSSSSEIKNT